MSDANGSAAYASLVFLGVADFARKPVAEQAGLRERLDAAVVRALAALAPADRIVADAFRVNEHVLITAVDDPLAGGTAVSPDALNGRSWLLREPGSGTRTVNEEFIAAAGLDVPTLTVGSNGAIKQAARAGLGVSFVSRDAVDAELEAELVGVIAVEPGPAPRDWHLMHSRVGPPRAGVQDFVEFVGAPTRR